MWLVGLIRSRVSHICKHLSFVEALTTQNKNIKIAFSEEDHRGHPDTKRCHNMGDSKLVACAYVACSGDHAGWRCNARIFCGSEGWQEKIDAALVLGR